MNDQEEKINRLKTQSKRSVIVDGPESRRSFESKMYSEKHLGSLKVTCPLDANYPLVSHKTDHFPKTDHFRSTDQIKYRSLRIKFDLLKHKSLSFE